MKTFTFTTNQELKAATTNNMGTNPSFTFSQSDIKTVNGIELRYCEISAKYLSYYVGGGEIAFIDAPFTVILK